MGMNNLYPFLKPGAKVDQGGKHLLFLVTVFFSCLHSYSFIGSICTTINTVW